MNGLSEGLVCRGTVTHLTHFGAFVDLGGAGGLIHISEISWDSLEHPGDVLRIGDELEVYVLKLDHKRQRISLSLKQLQPNPWQRLAEIYEIGQLVTGFVTKVVDFGTFVRLATGLDGLRHLSEIVDPEPNDPREFLEAGDELVLLRLQAGDDMPILPPTVFD